MHAADEHQQNGLEVPADDFVNSAIEEEEVDQARRYEDFTTIDWIQDSIVERNRRLRNATNVYGNHRGPNGEVTIPWLWSQFRKLVDGGQTWFVVTLVGVCIGVNAALISIVTEWLSDLKMGYCSDGWWLNQQFCCWEVETDEGVACDSWRPWSTVTGARWLVYVTYAACFSFISAHLVRSVAKYAAGSGISEIKCILAGFIMKGFLGFWTFIIKSLTLPLVIASGLSVGKEGPSVHVACCIGYLVAGLFTRFVHSQGKMREILTAASAAGVAVAFGSPIGGVLFSIEEMSHTFSIKTMWRSFFCALVATVVLSAMNPFRTGKLVLFQVTYDRDWHFFEIIFFVILGIFGGLYGAFVVKFNLQVAAFRKKHLARHGVAEAVTLASLTAMVGYFNRFLRIDMTESMAVLFRECESGGDFDNLCQTSVQWRMVNSLLLATIIRMGLVIISYGCKVPAGIFVPSMAIGATFGRMIGIMVKALWRAYPKSGIFAVCQPDVPCITPGTYAFLGAAAALSGIMRITVTVVVIMFELTGALTYILPTMIVLLVTKAVGDFLGTRGIADEMIRFNGFPFLEKEDHAFNVPVSRVMTSELHALPVLGLSLRDIKTIMSRADVQGYPIISADGSRTLLGYIAQGDLRYVIERAQRLQSISTDTPCTFAPDDASGREQTNLAGFASAIGMDEEVSAEIMQRAASNDSLNFWPWVYQTPLTVSPQLPLEIVMQIFKRMGPRVILVEDRGSLAGLVTVKDVLRFTLTDRHGQHTALSWDDHGGLGGILEEVWTWILQAQQKIASWSRRILRRMAFSTLERYLISVIDISFPVSLKSYLSIDVGVGSLRTMFISLSLAQQGPPGLSWSISCSRRSLPFSVGRSAVVRPLNAKHRHMYGLADLWALRRAQAEQSASSASEISLAFDYSDGEINYLMTHIVCSTMVNPMTFQYRYHGLVWESETPCNASVFQFASESAEKIPRHPTRLREWIAQTKTMLMSWEKEWSSLDCHRCLPGSVPYDWEVFDDSGEAFKLLPRYLTNSRPDPSCAIDFDRNSFDVSGWPLFDIDRMPPMDETRQLHYRIHHNRFGHMSYSGSTPRLDRSLPGAPVIRSCRIACAGVRQVSVSRMLRDYRWPSMDEQVRVSALEFLVGACMSSREWFLRYQAAMNESASPQDFFNIASSLMSLISPLSYDFGCVTRNLQSSMEASLDAEWPRCNICVYYTRSLDDATSVDCAVSALISIAQRRYTSGDVWGVACSITRCVVVRIDAANGGACSHSGALEFLPSWYDGALATEGIIALAQLLHVPPQPVSSLSLSTNHDSSSFPLLRLPLELIDLIASHMELVEDRWNLVHALPFFHEVLHRRLQRFTVASQYRLVHRIPRLIEDTVPSDVRNTSSSGGASTRISFLAVRDAAANEEYSELTLEAGCCHGRGATCCYFPCPLKNTGEALRSLSTSGVNLPGKVSFRYKTRPLMKDEVEKATVLHSCSNTVVHA